MGFLRVHYPEGATLCLCLIPWFLSLRVVIDVELGDIRSNQVCKCGLRGICFACRLCVLFSYLTPRKRVAVQMTWWVCFVAGWSSWFGLHNNTKVPLQFAKYECQIRLLSIRLSKFDMRGMESSRYPFALLICFPTKKAHTFLSGSGKPQTSHHWCVSNCEFHWQTQNYRETAWKMCASPWIPVAREAKDPSGRKASTMAGRWSRWSSGSSPRRKLGELLAAHKPQKKCQLRHFLRTEVGSVMWPTVTWLWWVETKSSWTWDDNYCWCRMIQQWPWTLGYYYRPRFCFGLQSLFSNTLHGAYRTRPL